MTFTDSMKKMRSFITSLRLTISLIVSLGVIFLLGLWIPQKGVVGYEAYLVWKANSPLLVSIIERTGLMDIYRAPLTLFLWGCFFVNLSMVMWQRIPIVKRRLAIPDPLPSPGGGFPHKAAIELSFRLSFDELKERLSAKGYRLNGTEGLFYAVRNRLSPLASLLFHLSFFLILLGGVISVYTRFVGQVDLAEGEVFQGEPGRYNASPLLPRFGGYPDVRIAIKKITPLVKDQTPTGLMVMLEDDAGRLRQIDINQPYRRGIVSFVIKDLGLAPLVILKDRSGKELDGAFVKLNVFRGKEDGFKMSGIDFSVRFFPDHEISAGEDRTRSEEFRNPVLLLLARKGDSSTIFRIPCRSGAVAEIGDITFELAKVSYWVRFTVVSEKGVPLVYCGFLLACSGLLWRLVLYRRELAGSMEIREDGGSTLQLAFRSEFYRSLAEEEFEVLRDVIARQPDDRE